MGDEKKHSASGSAAEDLFIEIFCKTFGVDKADYLYSQYPFYDIYQNCRYADFVIENGPKRIAIEIDDDATHHPGIVSDDKYYDDMLKHNSMVHLGWYVFRWAVRQLMNQAETVSDELRVFLGRFPHFRLIDDYLPVQRGRSLSCSSQLELRDYQVEALEAVAKLRREGNTIALLHQATGTGKTVVAVMDAKAVGGRTLFVAHTKELVRQACDKFKELWPEVSVGLFVDQVHDTQSHVICASIQSLALHLDEFEENAFDEVIIDEAHHASSDSYQKVLAWFRPTFTLGLTATPERTDGVDILEIFQKTAHRLDIQSAVEIGALVSVRCFRIHTNIDLSEVRFNGCRYFARELEQKIFVPERNQLIVKTWLDFVRGKRTVIFCASVAHAKDIAQRLQQAAVGACAVSGTMTAEERESFTARFRKGDIEVLCACDLLNEGWDCPETEVLFMARPTMSKTLYLQQLGRGMRKAPGKEALIVFDFVDNASLFNAPCTLHRIFKLKAYHPGALVVAPKAERAAEAALYVRGEKPDLLIDWPVYALDYERVDLFNWQDEAASMVSQMAFVRRVSVQSGTIENYIKQGKIKADLEIPMSDRKVFRYFKEETVQRYAKEFGWTLITKENRRELFWSMIQKMDMTFSYKPVFVKAVLAHADRHGRARLADIANDCRKYYEDRKRAGLVVEKQNSLYCREDYSDAEVIRNILANPFRRFDEMQLMHHTRSLGIIQIDEDIWPMTAEEIAKVCQICDEKLVQYYRRFEK
ncbi:MAG: DEAD/DEAH box helicase [Proteobacteria bacterium]|nr:DEAD/DEAH box helicase [Pseudomonadota bacterium]